MASTLGQLRQKGDAITHELSITALEPGDDASRDAAAHILFVAFDNPERYSRARITEQLTPAAQPFYRHFLIARHADEVVGIGGIKAADWASDTHILYLSAVTEHARGQGIARALIAARIAWAMENFTTGRLLVSTARPRRFARLGFRLMGKQEAAGRRLMLMEF
ncbi:GNAT family N-acetyltransferase [Dokdonella sp.]|uniref:GNAT family N-acetyltransferase n=1 Tax=Dokdonella sp. TaxID=2291710 RepID=UPI002DD6B2D2|nr:GNAT family N-acetyltransferase [Dokdonella sp.]